VDSFILPKEPRLCWNSFFSDGVTRSPFNQFGNRPAHYLFWARNAIYHGLAALAVKPGDQILVPAFHCATLVDAILQYGAEVQFYDINADLTPNFSHIEDRIREKTKAILAIHYCGFPQPIEEFRTLCRKRNIYLIEDCAHVLPGMSDGNLLGSFGDIGVFSLRKFFPIYDGGLLIINNPDLKLNIVLETTNPFLSLKILKNTLERSFANRQWSRAVALASVFLKIFGNLSTTARDARNLNSYDLSFDLHAVNRGMSWISKKIVEHTYLPTLIARRRHNYQKLSDAIENLPGVTALYAKLPENITPWEFPLLSERKNLHLPLRARGIPATTWGGVIHPTLRLESYPGAQFLYDHLVFLPIHQSLEEQDISNLTSGLRQIVTS